MGLTSKKFQDMVDAGNSTTQTLAGGATFTGEWKETINFAAIVINIFTDQPSANLGFRIEWSQNGVNLDDFDAYNVEANSGRFFTFGPETEFYRIVYTNGATPQATFRLETILKTKLDKVSSHRIADSISGENDAELVKAVNTAQDPNDIFVNSRLDGKVNNLSTTTPLSAGAAFTSPVVSTKGYLTVDFTIISNVISAANGVVLKWFADSAGTLLLKESIFGYSNAGLGSFYNVPVQSEYLRIVYTNGGTNQASFALDTRFKLSATLGLLTQIDSQLTGDLLAMLTRAVLFGRTEAGNLFNVALSNSNSLKVAVTDRPSEVRNRTRVLIPLTRTNLTGTPTVFYTVTGGKTLYISSFLITALNASASDGEFRLRDDTTVRIPFLIPSRVSGSSPSAFSVTAPTLPEPLPFSTTVNFLSITGTLEIAGYMIGYEE